MTPDYYYLYLIYNYLIWINIKLSYFKKEFLNYRLVYGNENIIMKRKFKYHLKEKKITWFMRNVIIVFGTVSLMFFLTTSK